MGKVTEFFPCSLPRRAALSAVGSCLEIEPMLLTAPDVQSVLRDALMDRAPRVRQAVVALMGPLFLLGMRSIPEMDSLTVTLRHDHSSSQNGDTRKDTSGRIAPASQGNTFGNKIETTKIYGELMLPPLMSV